jgi:hypothetical protein
MIIHDDEGKLYILKLDQSKCNWKFYLNLKSPIGVGFFVCLEKEKMFSLNVFWLSWHNNTSVACVVGPSVNSQLR